jgi:DNA-binding CsgD family transcriptional regulator/tetratricopeptide (TPR) repeat protein
MVGRISSPRFVGRVAELRALEQLLERAAAGTGGAMLVAGEAGIGKSRLVSELEARAHAGDALVLVGECVELAEGELAFSPIIAALRGVMEEAVALEGLGDPLRAALAVLWPTSGETEGVVAGREQLFEAVYRVLARLAEARPVLLIVEDVHWIDRSSRDLLAFLVRNARRDAIALIATYRPDELHRGHPLRPFLAELERSGQAKRLELEALARFEIAEQLQAIAGHVPDGTVIERIFARSEGNPFFAEELLATVDWVGGELPGSLREALLLRVERLAEFTQEVLRAAAVVGRSVDHRLLASVAGVAEPKLLGALREAVDHHVLVPRAGGVAYEFRHALLREAIYDDTLIGDRLRLHRTIAETLAAHHDYAGTGAMAELAYHWHAAGDAPAALAVSVPAVDEAERMHAYGEALGHVDRALALWDRVDAPREVVGCDRIELLLRGSLLAEWAGDAERSLVLAEQARAGVDEGNEPLRAAAAETRIGRAMHFAGRGADAVEHLTAARRLVPTEPPSVQYAEALAAEGRVLMLSGRMLEAAERLEQAIPVAEFLDARAVKANALNSLAIVYAEAGERDRSIRAGREGLRMAEELGAPDEIARAYINGSQAIDDAGRIEEALALGMEGIAAAERFGMGRAQGDQLRMQAGWRLTRMGRLDDAEHVLSPALERATSQFNVAGCTSIAGRIAAERGDFELAERRLERAWALMQRSGGFQLIGTASAWRVSLELQRGELDRARERLAEGLSRLEGSEGELIYNAELYWLAARVQADVAELARARGDPDGVARALESAAVALGHFDRVLSRARGDGPVPEALAFRALAEAELGRLRGVRDSGPWHVAAERSRELSGALRAAYADFRAAEALAMSGARAAEIAVPLQTAFAVTTEHGARPLREEIQALARRARVVLGPEHAPPPDPAKSKELGLTGRELEVLRLLADGRTNRQIGEQLFISAKTASVHVSRILMKLGVANRAEAAAAAHRMGLARPVD